jgi:tRNA isopentenyl-2-thiomethyl-A-37 hydroxylase MiaE
MQVLHRALVAEEHDAAIVELYESLLACEARHHGAYLELARTLGPRADVDARLDALARHEAAVIAGAPTMARLHANLR